MEPKIEEPADEEDQPSRITIRKPSAEVEVEVAVTMDRNKIKELVTTEISLERQLESVQSQLMALKQLPSEIEKHLKIVSEQLHKIMELSGVEQDRLTKGERNSNKPRLQANKQQSRILKVAKDNSRKEARNP